MESLQLDLVCTRDEALKGCFIGSCYNTTCLCLSMLSPFKSNINSSSWVYRHLETVLNILAFDQYMKRFCFKELRMSLRVLGPYYAHDSTFKIIFSNKYMSMSLRGIYFRQHVFCLHLMTTESFDVDKNAMSQHWLSFGIFVLIRIISATMALWQLKYIEKPYTNLNLWWHSR